MKSCPTCNRTYPDDTLAFCLVDGSILSAPYNSEATQRIPPSGSTNPPATEVLHPDSTSKAPSPETVLSHRASDASLPETTLVSSSPISQTAPRRTKRGISSILIWILAAGTSLVIGYEAYDFAKKFIDLRNNNLYDTDYKAWEQQHILTNIIHFSTFFLVAILTFIACVFIVRWWNRRIKQP
jgi:hypothetical protein